MTKIKILLTAAVLLAALVFGYGDAYGQVKVMGVTGFGASFEDGGTFGMFIGGDIPIYTDTARGFKSYTRTVMQFSDRDSELKEDQGIAFWQMAQRRLFSWATVAVGGGMTYNIKEGDDEQASGVKIELAIAPINAAAIIIGFDYLPDAGLCGQDVKFIYGGVNLLP